MTIKAHSRHSVCFSVLWQMSRDW